MKAKRFRTFNNSNFALYKLEEYPRCWVNIRIMDQRGMDTEVPNGFNCIIAVREMGYTGMAKGKTGAHALNADNTAEIEVSCLIVGEDGKVSAKYWKLIDQDELDRLYRQRKAFSI